MPDDSIYYCSKLMHCILHNVPITFLQYISHNTCKTAPSILVKCLINLCHLPCCIDSFQAIVHHDNACLCMNSGGSDKCV